VTYDYLLLLVLEHTKKTTFNGEGHCYCLLLFLSSVMQDVVHWAYTAENMFISHSKQKRKREKICSHLSDLLTSRNLKHRPL